MQTKGTWGKALLLAFAAFVVGAALGSDLFQRARAPEAKPAVQGQRHDLYQCPMHPQIVQDHPGFCPICHMRLEKVDDDDSGASASMSSAGAAPKIIRYRNPMDPTIFSDHPMKDSMGMDYIPVTEAPDAESSDAVPGKSGFTLSRDRRQLIGVGTAKAEVQPIVLTLRLPGRCVSGSRVSAQLLEIDAGTLKAGMRAQLQGPDGTSTDAEVTSVGGVVDDLTHSFEIGLRATSPAPWLRPGLFCVVLVEANLGKRLAVPQEAVLDTGERQVIFVEDGGGRFEPRQVALGAFGDDLVEIKKGVVAGERVVSSANFLIDSESRFQAALDQFRGGRP